MNAMSITGEKISGDQWVLIEYVALSLSPECLPSPTVLLKCNKGHVNTIDCFLQMRNGLLNLCPEKEKKFSRQHMFF